MPDLWFGTSGPRTPGSLMLVGESWGFEEEQAQRPFVGSSGKELDRMLSEAGLARSEIFCTNVIPRRPPNNEMWHFFWPSKGAPVLPLRGLHPTQEILDSLKVLYEQIEAIQPRCIIACGNYALWALTNCTSYTTPSDAEGRRCPSGIMQWRGSLWHADAAPGRLCETRLLPLIHPAAILRAWYNRAVTVHDLRTRVAQAPSDWRPAQSPLVWAPPTFPQAKDRLAFWLRQADHAPLRLMNDIETARGLITCIGFADSPHFAMSVPFVRTQPGAHFESFWSQEEEHVLVSLIRRVLSHPRILIEGQNYLYDTQYIESFFACLPSHDFDSMLAHHLLFPGTPKGLDYLSSLYCRHHWYWKEDHKEWDMRGSIEQLLAYNALDCLRNYEVNTVLRGLIPKMQMEAQWAERRENNALALSMMRKGVRIDRAHRAQLSLELAAAADDLSRWFSSIVPQAEVAPDAKVPWFASPTQQRIFFGNDLGLRLPLHRKTGNETFGKEALTILRERHPEFTRLFDMLGEFRSIRTFHNNFIKADLDPDERMRCMFNTAGTETFRWSSSTNAFGAGTNLQNIPKGEED